MTKPQIPEVLQKFVAYFTARASDSLSGGWGCLHLVLEDDNVDDGSVIFCRESAVRANDVDAVELCDILLQMSPSQRGRIDRKVWEHIRK